MQLYNDGFSMWGRWTVDYYGTIFMPRVNERSLDLSGAEILGIYGQNGSRKTAVVDTLFSYSR